MQSGSISNPFEYLDEKLEFIKNLLLSKNSEESVSATKDRYTKKEAANELSCSVAMIDKLLMAGRLEKIKIGEKVLIPRQSIDNILGIKNKKVLNTKIVTNDTVEVVKIVSGMLVHESVINSGIYFLYKDGELIYIGKSKNVYSRIGSHITSKNILFDKFKILPVDKNMDIYEQGFIKHFRPKYNGNYNGIFDKKHDIIKPFIHMI